MSGGPPHGGGLPFNNIPQSFDEPFMFGDDAEERGTATDCVGSTGPGATPGNYLPGGHAGSPVAADKDRSPASIAGCQPELRASNRLSSQGAA
jgi:hypothetical protein